MSSATRCSNVGASITRRQPDCVSGPPARGASGRGSARADTPNVGAVAGLRARRSGRPLFEPAVAVGWWHSDICTRVIVRGSCRADGRQGRPGECRLLPVRCRCWDGGLLRRARVRRRVVGLVRSGWCCRRQSGDCRRRRVVVGGSTSSATRTSWRRSRRRTPLRSSRQSRRCHHGSRTPDRSRRGCGGGRVWGVRDPG